MFMKKLPLLFFLFSLLAILIFSSCREGLVEPTRLLELKVVDTLGVAVPNAKVDFYLSERELNTNRNPLIESLYTNEEGIIKVALDVEIFDYYVNIEKDELNNWYTNTFINLPNLMGTNTTVVTLSNPFQAKLTGKYKKRWQQVENLINGNPSLPSCTNQLYHDFVRRIEIEKNKRDGEVEKYQSSVCPFPGQSEGINIWTYNKQNNTITLGVDNFSETYKITEFTGDKLSLLYTTPDGAFRVERKYKLIN